MLIPHPMPLSIHHSRPLSRVERGGSRSPSPLGRRAWDEGGRGEIRGANTPSGICTRVTMEADMRVLKINELKETPMGTATPIDGWSGGAVRRTRQAVIGDGQSEHFRCNVVNFSPG